MDDDTTYDTTYDTKIDELVARTVRAPTLSDVLVDAWQYVRASRPGDARRALHLLEEADPHKADELWFRLDNRLAPPWTTPKVERTR